MNFATNLQKLRKKENMSQESLAEKLDVTRQSVSKWESGATYPEMDKLIAICKIFNVDMDTLVNGDVSAEKEKKDKEASINPKDLLDKFNTFMKKIVCCFESMSFNEILGFIATVFLLIIIICIGRIPIALIENLIGNGLLYDITYVGPTLNTLFCLILDILYAVFAIVVFIYVLKIKYLDRIKIKEKDNIEVVVKEKEKKVEEEIKEVIIKNDDNNSFTKLLAKIIIYIVKFFIICFLFAPFLCLIFLGITLGFLVLLVFNGLPLLGILLWVISALLICIILFEVPLNFVINHKNSYRRVMITLLISFVIFVLGAIFFAFEFFSITYIDEIPNDAKEKEITETFNMTSGFNTVDFAYDTEYIADESLTDKVEVTVTYYDYLVENDVEIDIHGNNLVIYYDGPKKFSFKDILDEVSKDIKEGKIYNYDELNYYKVTIRTSSKNINTINQNNLNYYK